MHGTGTALGDPIEIGALVAVFDRPGESTVGWLKADCYSHTIQKWHNQNTQQQCQGLPFSRNR